MRAILWLWLWVWVWILAGAAAMPLGAAGQDGDEPSDRALGELLE